MEFATFGLRSIWRVPIFFIVYVQSLYSKICSFFNYILIFHILFFTYFFCKCGLLKGYCYVACKNCNSTRVSEVQKNSLSGHPNSQKTVLIDIPLLNAFVFWQIELVVLNKTGRTAGTFCVCYFFLHFRHLHTHFIKNIIHRFFSPRKQFGFYPRRVKHYPVVSMRFVLIRLRELNLLGLRRQLFCLHEKILRRVSIL